MAKNASEKYECSACGAAASLWAGRCPQCGEWGTLEKSASPPVPGAVLRSSRPSRVDAASVLPPARLKTGMEELDRVLGGGWVPGGVFLLGGSPG